MNKRLFSLYSVTGTGYRLYRLLTLLFLPVFLLMPEAFAEGSAVPSLVLPASLSVVNEQAFFGDVNLDEVILPETVVRIEKKAFADSSIITINLPSGITYIADDAFSNCDSMTAIVEKYSYAHQYCADHDIDYVFSDDPDAIIRPPTYRALVIGEQRHLDYDNEEQKYIIDDCTRNTADADNIEKMLLRVYGSDGTGQYAVTKKIDAGYTEICNSIKNTFADTTDYDISLFFIATHGYSDDDGDLAMPFKGDPDNLDDVYDYLGNHYYLSFSTLASWLKQYVRGRVIVIIESCGSGSSIYDSDLEQNGAKNSTEGNNNNPADLASAAVYAFELADPGIEVYDDTGTELGSNTTGDLRIPKFYVLAASRHHELSWGSETGDVQYSYNAFTNWLIEGVGYPGNSPADCSPQDTYLSLTELFDYIRQYDTWPFYSDGITYYQHVQRYPVGSQFKLFVVK